VPPNLLANFRTAVFGYLTLIAAHSHDKNKHIVKKYRAAGRNLLDADMLLFICFRYDSRRPLVHFSKLSQSLTVSGFERVKQEFVTLDRLRARIGGVHAAIGLVRTSALLFACTGRAKDSATLCCFWVA
jgi:hypothetical protein